MHTPNIGQPSVATPFPTPANAVPKPAASDSDGDHDNSPPSDAAKAPGVGGLLDTKA